MAIEAPRTLLVLKPSSFGDIVHTLPAVSRLKAAWPACRVSWLVNTEWIPLLAGNPDVDEIIEFPRREFCGWGGGWAMWKWARKEMRGRRFDLALDFQGLLRTALIGRLSGARLLVGLSDAREGARWFYHRTVASPRQPVHAVERYLALADEMLRECAVYPVGGGVAFPLSAGEMPEVSFDFDRPFAVIHPYARGKGKSLEPKQISEIIRKINNERIVLVGRSDTSENDSIAGCLNLLNATTLDQLLWLIRKAAFVVSVDSGPAHVAAALGKPMVAIHAWSDPRKVGPHHPDAWVWKNGIMTQVRNLASMDEHFFESKPLQLADKDTDAIAALATSPSHFSA